MVRCDRLAAAAINRATSSTLKSCGNRRGALGYGVSSSRYRRFSVFTKKKRNAATWRRTVSGCIFRSRRRYTWYDPEMGLIPAGRADI